MSEELKPCRCNADINESFEVQLVWQGLGEDVGVAYCKYCKDVVPFKIGGWERRSISEKAIAAWNKRTET